MEEAVAREPGRIAWAILLSNRQRERARQLRRLALLETRTRSQELALDILIAQVERMEKAEVRHSTKAEGQARRTLRRQGVASKGERKNG
jgi:hypothetical protein